MKHLTISYLSLTANIIGILLFLVSCFISNIYLLIGGLFLSLTALYLYIFYNINHGGAKFRFYKAVSIALVILYIGLAVYIPYQLKNIPSFDNEMEIPPEDHFRPRSNSIRAG